MSTIIGYTTNYGLAKIDFNAATWHTEMNQNLDDIDTVIRSLFGVAAVTRGVWKNSTAYVVTDGCIDPDTLDIYRCAVNHTSPASGTFAAARIANPTYWVQANISAISSTSTTSLAVTVAAKTFVTQASKEYTVGAFVLIRSSAAPSTNWMFGQITGYSGTNLDVNVTIVGGSGTYADWLIAISGPQGPTGPQGPQGIPGVTVPDATNAAAILCSMTFFG